MSKRKTYYPVFLELEGKDVLVVGGGQVARRKVETLLEYGASVKTVSKGLSSSLQKQVEEGRICYLGPEFEPKCLDGIFLVIAATDDRDLNHQISEEARRRGILVNAVDQPQDCNIIMPSIVRRGDLMIAISTSGRSPALAKKIREDLEVQYGQEYEIFLSLMGRMREVIFSRGLPQSENSRIFREAVNSDILSCLARGDWQGTYNTLQKITSPELASELHPEELSKF